MKRFRERERGERGNRVTISCLSSLSVSLTQLFLSVCLKERKRATDRPPETERERVRENGTQGDTDGEKTSGCGKVGGCLCAPTLAQLNPALSHKHTH